MGSILVTVLPALLPALSDGLRSLLSRLTGGAGAKPQNVAEVIQLMQADTARLAAIAQLDQPGGNASQWVSDLRGAMRPVACILVILAYIGALAFAKQLPDGDIAQLSVYAQMVTFYLFGDRSYQYFKAGK